MTSLNNSYKMTLLNVTAEGKVPSIQEEVLMRLAYFRGASDGMKLAATIASTDENPMKPDGGNNGTDK